MPHPHCKRSALLVVATLTASAIAVAQSVPGFQVSTYANIPDPALCTFAADGSLYVGRDPVASGSATPQFVTKVAPGGGSFTSIGNAATPDPDTIAIDVLGTISGVPGSVIVGGLISTSLGRISAIHPDGSIAILWDDQTWANVVELKFDATGRLLFTGGESHSIWVTTGSTPVILATLPGAAYPTYLTLAPNGNIVVGATDGVVRVYSSTGVLLNGSFATFGSLGGLEYAQGGVFGTDLYAIDTTAGTLVRVAPNGAKTTIGSGFATGNATKDLAVGPGGSLFVTVNTSDVVLRIDGPWSDLGFALAGVQGDPQLVAMGPAAAHSTTSFALSNARQASFGALVLGASRIDLPIFGGVLVPKNDLVLTYATSAAGTAAKSFAWPPTMPVGLSIYAQAWTLDAAAVQGFSASNALETTSL